MVFLGSGQRGGRRRAPLRRLCPRLAGRGPHAAGQRAQCRRVQQAAGGLLLHRGHGAAEPFQYLQNGIDACRAIQALYEHVWAAIAVVGGYDAAGWAVGGGRGGGVWRLGEEGVWASSE